jgi:hypothetical protein
MAVATLNQVLELAEELPADEKEMLVEILRRRRTEAWRKELAAYARKAVREHRAGKLRAIPAVELDGYLTRLWKEADA